MSVPFVGRQRELDALADLLERARRERRPVAAIVTGEPGSGKSRLLAELVARAGAVPVARVVGFEPTRSIPLAAARELLRRLASAGAQGSSLDRILFAEGEDRGTLRIFEAAHRALQRHGPLVVAVDDLQWVDGLSVALLQFLLRAASATGGGLAVVIVARPSETAQAMRSALETELPDTRRLVLDLPRLDSAAGVELARAIDPSLGPGAAAALWERAGGSPFWLEALARAGSSGQDLGTVVENRLIGLGADAGALLAALAVGARPFAIGELAALLEWTPERTHSAGSELAARGLAVGSMDVLRLAHDLIREAATVHLPRETRRRLHARLAGWIEATAGTDLPLLCEALDHRLAADLPASSLASRIAASPRRRLLTEANLRRLAAIADTLATGSDDQLELDAAIGEIAGVLGEPDLARERWVRVAAVASEPRTRQQAELEAARSAYALDRGPDVHAHLDRALAAATPPPEVAIAIGALRSETLLWLDHRTADGAHAASAALAAAEQMVADRGGLESLDAVARHAYLRALHAAADAALQEDRGTDVLRLSELTVDVARGLDEAAYLDALSRTAFALRPLGRIRESTERYQEAWELAHRMVLPISSVDAGHGLARGLRDLGRLAEARAIAAETVQLEQRLRTAPRRWGTAPTILHGIELALGEPAALDRLERDVEREHDPHFRIGIHSTIALWRAQTGGAREAPAVLRQLTRAREAARIAGCPRCGLELTLTGAETLARIGHVDDARGELDAAAAGRTPEYLQRRLWRAQAETAIALAEARWAEAASASRATIDALEAAGMRHDLAWAWIDLGRAAAAGDRTTAVDAFTTAAALAAEMEARGIERVAARHLRALGVRAWRRGPAHGGVDDGGAALSPREREIAALVAEGRSNREIADALLVAPKTVERHVTNLLAKLGLRNRVEVATAVGGGLVRESPDE